MQLQAYGKQDKCLTGNPEITFFKYVYKRYHNFSIETAEEILNTTGSVDEHTVFKTICPHGGDLMHKAHLQITFTAGTTMDNKGTSTNYLSFTNNTGHAYVKEASILIGDQEIDKHYSEWFDIWNELSDPYNLEHLSVNKHNAKTSYYKSTKNDEVSDPNDEVIYIESDDKLTCYVPLKFWFNMNPGLALPLIALQYHSIKFKFLFRKLDGLFNSNTTFSNPTIAPDVKLYVDYIYLEEDQRRKFATDQHKYLITQLQRSGPETLKTSHDLIFNHPVKELIWVCRNSRAGTEGSDPATNGANFDGSLNISSATGNFGGSWNYNDYFNYSSPDRSILTEVIGGSKSYEPFTYATLLFNGIERFSKRRPSYFRIAQPSSYHSNIPGKHIYSYSFCLKPEEYQPSGTCNFSMIQTPQLRFDTVCGSGQLMEIIIFAVNYNQLCIKDGMAGIRFST